MSKVVHHFKPAELFIIDFNIMKKVAFPVGSVRVFTKKEGSKVFVPDHTAS